MCSTCPMALIMMARGRSQSPCGRRYRSRTMPANLLARLGLALSSIVKSRRSASLAAAIVLVLVGTGVAGARQLRADTVTPAPTPTASASPTDSLPDANAGPKNIVQVRNLTDGALRVDGRVQLGRIPGSGAGPGNIASAFSSCTDCQTLAVALQINLFTPTATVFTPQNAAVAANGGCNACETVAYAAQYNIGVDDPTQVPPRVNQLVASMKAQLAQASARSSSLTQ